MPTIKRQALAFPQLKAGDTYPAFTLPDLDPVDMYTAGSTVLGQIRDAQGCLWFNWAGAIVSGKVQMVAIEPDDSRRFKAGDYTVEVQVTTPAGAVTTEAHAGKITVLADNCYLQIIPPLIVPGEGGSGGTGGVALHQDSFAFDGAGPYETDFVPDGVFAMLFLDGVFQSAGPFELTPTGFTLVGVPTGYENVSLLYSH